MGSRGDERQQRSGVLECQDVLWVKEASTSHSPHERLQERNIGLWLSNLNRFNSGQAIGWSMASSRCRLCPPAIPFSASSRPRVARFAAPEKPASRACVRAGRCWAGAARRTCVHGLLEPRLLLVVDSVLLVRSLINWPCVPDLDIAQSTCRGKATAIRAEAYGC